MQPILQQAGNGLLDVLRQALVPAVLHDADAIQIAYPNAEQDYQIGVFLYDMEEIASILHLQQASVRSQYLRGKKKLIEQLKKTTYHE